MFTCELTQRLLLAGKSSNNTNIKHTEKKRKKKGKKKACLPSCFMNIPGHGLNSQVQQDAADDVPGRFS